MIRSWIDDKIKMYTNSRIPDEYHYTKSVYSLLEGDRMYELEGPGVIPLNKKSYSSSRDIV
jgi:hypothetical protein